MSASVTNCASAPIAHSPPDCHARGDIDDSSEIEISFCCFNSRDVGDPFGMWGRSAKLAIEQIGSHRMAVMAIGGPHAPAFALCADPALLHQTSDAFASTSFALLLQLGMNAWTAIDPSVRLEDVFYLLCEHLVFLCPFGDFPLAPGVIATFRHLQSTAHQRNGIFPTVSLNEVKFHSWLCAKIRTAFFNTSRSCLRMSFSRRSRRFSSSSSV